MMARASAILTYHSIDDSGSVISISPDRFRHQMEFLAGSSIPVVPLDQAVSRPGSVAITFDDGYRNLLDHAIPVLDRYKLPATIFLVSRFCGRTNNWPDQPSGAVPSLPLMSWEELKELPALISPGAHTATHRDLSRLPSAECESEFKECQDEIEQHLAKPARWLAYPYGTSSAGVRALAARHFDLAVGTSLRFLASGDDTLDLPRIDGYYLRAFAIERLFTPEGGLYVAVRNALRKVRQMAS